MHNLLFFSDISSNDRNIFYLLGVQDNREQAFFSLTGKRIIVGHQVNIKLFKMKHYLGSRDTVDRGYMGNSGIPVGQSATDSGEEYVISYV